MSPFYRQRKGSTEELKTCAGHQASPQQSQIEIWVSVALESELLAAGVHCLSPPLSFSGSYKRIEFLLLQGSHQQLAGNPAEAFPTFSPSSIRKQRVSGAPLFTTHLLLMLHLGLSASPQSFTSQPSWLTQFSPHTPFTSTPQSKTLLLGSSPWSALCYEAAKQGMPRGGGIMYSTVDCVSYAPSV